MKKQEKGKIKRRVAVIVILVTNCYASIDYLNTAGIPRGNVIGPLL